MNDISLDVCRSGDVINGASYYNCRHIYFRTNERLNDLFSNFDVNDKKVLSVIGSGDQAFYAYDRGAESVDLFDKNKITIYYYYLRVWLIKYLDMFYFDKEISVSFLNHLLDLVKPETQIEIDTHRYWSEMIRLYGCNINYLFMCKNNLEDYAIRDVSKIKKKIDYIPNFYNIDIASDIDISHTYDVIIKSNITDHLNADYNKFIKYRNNLNNLLNSGGIVVSSNVLTSRISPLEEKIFSECFDIYPMDDVSDYSSITSPGFIYVKK